jgi:dienelactone hydrolase
MAMAAKNLNFRTAAQIGVAILIGMLAHAPFAAPDSESAKPPPVSTASGQSTSTQGKNSREQIIADRLELTTIGAQVVWLSAQSEEFLGLFRASDQQPPNGAVIYNNQPNEIVHNSPLQRSAVEMMVAAGWDTLAIQQLSSDGETSGDDQAEQRIDRVNAAIEYMRGRSIENIVLVGDAEGANIAIQCVKKSKPRGVVAIVGLGFWDEKLSDSEIRVLEIFGTTDGRATLEHERREANTKGRITPIDTIEIDGADASFRGYEDLVVKRLRGWLARSTPGKVVKRRRGVGRQGEG